MMIYVFDTNSLSVISNYYPDIFPSFWNNFNPLIKDGIIFSVKEVFLELEDKFKEDHFISIWINKNKNVFLKPDNPEMQFIQKIYSVSHFQDNLPQKDRSNYKHHADPFIIASAKIKNGCVVTEEKKSPHSAKIPNICEHFSIKCINLKEFIKEQEWSF